jgi:iron complex outermembrane receptor protein
VTSSNLGDHAYTRGAAFGEVRLPFADRGTIQAGVRLDGYSSFGHAWSPSASAGLWVSPEVRVRGSVSRAFRIPTYTELYYRDPAHLAQADLRPERAWSVDGGVDWTPAGTWLVAASVFRRWDEDVIDWVKASPSDVWKTTNVRDVTTTGVELSAQRLWRGVLVRASASSQTVDAPSLSLLSKYVLEYARHSAGGAVAVPVALGLRAAVTVDHRRRFAGPAYTLVSARLARAFGRAEIFVDASNLLNEDYYEVKGVAMPGRWVTAGFAIK